jgi:hypothetical protein
MQRRSMAGLALTVVLAAGALGVGTSGNAPARASTEVNPADFTAPTPNPYFPIKPGTVSIYRGQEGTDRLREHLMVTDRTKVIQGVTTRVVHDVMYANGHLAEKTVDWYANDNAGNVWYFGEATALYNEQGNITSTEGSWQAGVDGAVAGVIMPNRPRPTDAYRQEFLPGHAEDQAWIVQRDARVTVAFGTLNNVVRSFEWTRLEPDVVSEKMYARGLGIVREHDVAGGTEMIELVDVRTV